MMPEGVTQRRLRAAAVPAWFCTPSIDSAMKRTFLHASYFCLAVLAVGCDQAGPSQRAALTPTADNPRHADEPISYNRDIRPILSDKCFSCHGPDRAARKADLRLDMPEDGEGYFGAMIAIDPGNPEESELVERIHSTRTRTMMPPPESNLSLTDEEKALLVRWIDQGAEYEPHWAFVPLAQTIEVPAVEDPAWPRDDIDRFVLARLEHEGLSPTQEASRQRWIRRVTYDLTGLPPTPEDVAVFVDDQEAGAYERVVDRLLASPHYGEHMTMQWIDLARYADSYGYQGDQLSPNWPWRDWAIRAFNDNLPYDQFLTDQIAGDLKPDATTDQVLATAFNRLHRMTNEGGSINEEWLNEYTADRVQTFGTAFMGLTFECARCHDHRYDPIQQSEYYEMYAFFNSIDEWGMYMYQRDGFVPTPSVLLPSEQQAQRQAELVAQVEQAEQRLDQVIAERGGEPFSAWLSYLQESDIGIVIAGLTAHYPLDAIGEGRSLANTVAPDSPGNTHARNTIVEGHLGQALQFAGDTPATFNNALGGMQPFRAFSASLWISVPEPDTTALIFHNSQGTDVGFNGGWFTLEEGKLRLTIARFWPGNALAVQTAEPIPVGQWVHVVVTNDGTSSAQGMTICVNGRPVSEVLRDNLTKLPAQRGENIIFDERMRTQTIPGTAIDELRIYDRALAELEARDLYNGSALSDALSAPDAQTLRDYYLNAVDPEVAAARTALGEARHALLQFQTGLLEVSVMRDLPEPTPSYTLARGGYDAPKNDETRVYRDTPDALPPMPEGLPRNRLGLAQWLTDPGHPLTARVAVNRLWLQCFGEGLVGTPDNFGLQGSPPTHPELLDYLARQYITSGWDTKAMLRRIVLSATYRQDSLATAERWAADPGNELLSRGPSRRLAAEMLRDTALASSGLLNETLYGPPVAPYQPPNLWRESNGMSPAYRQSVGRDLYRRSIYTVWKRTAPMPNMIAFDAPGREVCTAERSSTNTPLQALVLLNDVQFVEACRVLVEHTIKAETQDPARLDSIYMRLAGRPADDYERGVMLALLERQREHYIGAPEDAGRLRQQGEAPIDEALDAVEVAAWINVVQVVLNSDATVWRR